MVNVLLIFLGSGLGALARYKLGSLALHQWPDWRFPVGTCLVNVLGCLVAGVLAGAAERQGLFTANTRHFLFTGLLGGFTTFSAFGLETVYLLRRGDAGAAFGYVILSVIGGVAAIWLGISMNPHRSA